MKRTRRNHSAEFKAQVAVFKSDKAPLELADPLAHIPPRSQNGARGRVFNGPKLKPDAPIFRFSAPRSGK